MTDFTKVRANLERRGFQVSCFAAAQEAADYLTAKLEGKTIGYGGSMTLKQLGLMERLEGRAALLGHWSGSTRQEAAAAPIYLTSVNGLAETGELISIDGTGNRVASTIFGHHRLGCKTPCAVKGDKCYDCSSPERICRALAVLWEKPKGIGRAEVVLIDEDLGY